MAQDINTFKNPANNNHYMIDYPTQVTTKLDDCGQFCTVFSQLVKDKVSYIEYNVMGVVTIHFKDGSSCGGMVPWFKSGAADRAAWERQANLAR